ncbi:ABC transporter ATP-binding protein [Marilutibacter chinensis]|uniref:ATP-binding cassette domain-containing protein n=1 Tax=Marilutibacter chinensis TaxID=2912247 RepID=A0ABS9HQV9_9GAMM|nr:ATP-binding cassette domain-containing protein [Lysobacter chinensis]MCF7221320.1 ATP-binding cassette domain-containing protein [Lysobacter chinensis]
MAIGLSARSVGLTIPHYVQGARESGSWWQTLVNASMARPHRVYRQILADVSFDAIDGDRVALIGRNGAGKSSLLKVLTGAYQPTTGCLEVHGKRQALLNISLGFNGQATVEENILLRGTAMGLSLEQIKEVTGQVLDFSGLAEVAQHRLYTLSAGQRMRLGFAVSTAVDQDIILLDEWLGAGDMQFIRKARARMNDRVRGSRIVILATHNLEIARRVCNKGVVLEQGRVAFSGGVIEAIMEYRRLCRG